MKKWDEMTARERDALVAEKVMGWEVDEIEDEMFGNRKSTRVRSLDFFQITAHVEWYDTQYADEMLPHYTTDISAAWEVVEKIRKNHGARIYIDWPDSYQVFIDPQVANATAKSAPEAICLAALHAVGVDV